MVKYKSDTLDAVFAALSDPTRRAILSKLSGGPCTVSALAQPFDMSLPAVSKHLRVLEEAGLVDREIEGRVHRVSLSTRSLRQVASWLEHYRQFWEERFAKMEKAISQPTKEGP